MQQPALAVENPTNPTGKNDSALYFLDGDDAFKALSRSITIQRKTPASHHMDYCCIRPSLHGLVRLTNNDRDSFISPDSNDEDTVQKQTKE